MCKKFDELKKIGLAIKSATEMHSEYHLDSDTENVPTGDLEFNTFVIEEVLISEVLERPCLWDHTMDIKIKGMDTVRKAWEEIGQVLNLDPKVCQKNGKIYKTLF
ncbi:uncharacterized protein [Cardiocondyla obscurior]|uniref:uncharacterized protein n=1 Tax=Cardiocondyla obscurior TaxID=286306 RepID=UPI0039656B83